MHEALPFSGLGLEKGVSTQLKNTAGTVLYTQTDRITVFNEHFSSHAGIKYLILWITFDYEILSKEKLLLIFT